MRRWSRSVGIVLVGALSGAFTSTPRIPAPQPPGVPADAERSAAEPAPVPPSTPAPPAFTGAIEPIGEATAERMRFSWRPGCPVPLSDLRLIELTHWGFDGQLRAGEIVVRSDVAGAVLDVFRALFDVRFPLEQVRLVDEFGGHDDRSMAANNTSGFNCRRAIGSTRWSEHAYGLAIDINPVQNPYVTRGGPVLPPAGHPFIRRDAGIPGLIISPGPVLTAFAQAGWRWGGRWRSPDYQHFSVHGG